MQIYFAIAFSVVAAILAAAPLVPQVKSRLPQSAWLAPAVLACLFIAAMLAPQPLSHLYKAAVLLGLLVAILAALMHAVPGMPGYASVAGFFVIVPVYLIAFASAHPLAVPTLWVLVVIAWVAALIWKLRTRPPEERYTLVALVTLAGLMLWQALEMWVHSGQVWSILGLAGALLLAAGGTLHLVHHMVTPIRGGGLLAVAAFYLSQGLIAWSVWGLGAPGV